MKISLRLFIASVLALSGCGPNIGPDSYDVVIYGGTSAGVIAAVQTIGLGKTVVLIEPGRHLGGLSSGGLGATDIGNKGA
ncbi:MAG: FAD-dependent oxidoreductase, partial [Candidatus Glassbacteria bacterium]